MANTPISMTTSQQVTLDAVPTLVSPPDPEQPAPLSANPIWSVDNGLIVGLVPNGLKCIVYAKKAGTCNVTCTAAGQGSLIVVQPFIITTALANQLGVTPEFITANQYVRRVP